MLNDTFNVLIIPIAITIFALFLEWATSVTRGRAIDDRKYMVMAKRRKEGVEEYVLYTKISSNELLDNKKREQSFGRNKEIVDIGLMYSFDLSEIMVSFAKDLTLGAFAVDISSLVTTWLKNTSFPSLIGYLIIFHVVLLIIIVSLEGNMFAIINDKVKRRIGIIAAILGLIAVFTTIMII